MLPKYIHLLCDDSFPSNCAQVVDSMYTYCMEVIGGILGLQNSGNI